MTTSTQPLDYRYCGRLSKKIVFVELAIVQPIGFMSARPKGEVNSIERTNIRFQ